MALLTCQDVTLGYERTKVVEGLNFSVNAGDYLCIVGENGSGKTTLMKTILHLQDPMSGHILTGDGLKATEIGYLPQQTVVQKDFPASVREIVLSGCLNHSSSPFYTREEKKQAEKNMQRMDIADLARHCYRELSGGQQQRVLLARALCAASRILLLDEPVAGLDPMAASDMYEMIEKLNKNDGLTIIMISHDTVAAVRYATKILHIGHKPLFFGTTADYLKSDVGAAYTHLARSEN